MNRIGFGTFHANTATTSSVITLATLYLQDVRGAGPAVAGLLIAVSTGAAYAVTLGLYAAAVGALLTIRRNTRPSSKRVRACSNGMPIVS